MLAQRGSAKAGAHRSLLGRRKFIHIALTLDARISSTKAAFCTMKMMRDAHLRVSAAMRCVCALRFAPRGFHDPAPTSVERLALVNASDWCLRVLGKSDTSLFS